MNVVSKKKMPLKLITKEFYMGNILFLDTTCQDQGIFVCKVNLNSVFFFSFLVHVISSVGIYFYLGSFVLVASTLCVQHSWC